MKAIFFVLYLSIVSSCFAQEGVITYKNTLNRHTTLPTDRQDLKTVVPEFSHTQKQLFFTDSTSLYKPHPLESGSEVFPRENGRLEISSPKTEVYYHKPSGTSMTQHDYKGTIYHILDTVKSLPWNFSDETKEILGYTCKKAYYSYEQELTLFKVAPENKSGVEKVKRTQHITAWYAEKLQPSFGPERYRSLPGMVLEIDINNGEQKIVAQNIELRKLSRAELELSQTGTPINRSVYKRILAERIKKELK